MGLISPKLRFRINRLRNRWQGVQASARQTGQSVLAEQKVCPSCRALVSRELGKCPYCGERLKVLSNSPVGRVASRVLPQGAETASIILLINLLMFGLEFILSGPSVGSFMSPTGAAAYRLGESMPLGYIFTNHEYWRWITAQFLHADLIHIGMNMLALFSFGPIVESYYGRQKFFFLYLTTGVVGFVVSGYGGHISLGASASLFGLIGVMIGYGVRNRRFSSGSEMRGMAVRWAVYGLVMTFWIPGVDSSAHIGGLVSGILLGWMVRDGLPVREAETQAWEVMQWVSVGAVVASFLLMAHFHPSLS